jgi:hypothetical protein
MSFSSCSLRSCIDFELVRSLFLFGSGEGWSKRTTTPPITKKSLNFQQKVQWLATIEENSRAVPPLVTRCGSSILHLQVSPHQSDMTPQAGTD